MDVYKNPPVIPGITKRQLFTFLTRKVALTYQDLYKWTLYTVYTYFLMWEQRFFTCSFMRSCFRPFFYLTLFLRNTNASLLDVCYKLVKHTSLIWCKWKHTCMHNSCVLFEGTWKCTRTRQSFLESSKGNNLFILNNSNKEINWNITLKINQSIITRSKFNLTSPLKTHRKLN